MPIEVFYSYSHRDEPLQKKLANHLSILERQGVIADWHDRRITAGDEGKGAIDEHLESAGIILLLVSADFLASDYCYDIELKRAMERHEAGTARVIPVILRAVDWSGGVSVTSRWAARTMAAHGRAMRKRCHSFDGSATSNCSAPMRPPPTGGGSTP